MRDADTIFALATPPGRSALSVIRVSGSAASVVGGLLTRSAGLKPRVASLRALYDPRTSEKIDEALVTYFPAPASFTGEDSLEFSLHGARSVVVALTAALSSLESVRIAEPGEFARRAFLNGKLDLTQAEAIADLIDSETEFQRRQALRVLGGSLGRRAEDWRARLIRVAAGLESVLDFSDEADVGELARLDIVAECKSLETEMDAELCASRRATALRDGFTIVIAGPPNTGKSSLFNMLVGRDAAIVTDLPGTTRDLIIGKLDLGGTPVTLIDSAGLRDTDDAVETIGIQRAVAAARSADLVLWLSSCEAPADVSQDFGAPVMTIATKGDLGGAINADLRVSIYDLESIAVLETTLRDRALMVVGDGSEGGLIRDRHKSALRGTMSLLGRLRVNVENDLVELAAEDCREAVHLVGGITGAVTTEDVLGEIFQRFCIGK